MEVQEFAYPWLFREGFYPDQPHYGGVPDTVAEGLNSWLYGSQWRSDRGTLSLGSSGGVSDLQVIGGQHAGCIGAGNIWRAFATTWFVGNAVINGASIGNSPGILSLLVGGTPTPAGLTTPSAPTFVGQATPGRLNGAYSVTVQAFRITTGARSSRSAPSATISVINKLARVTFPAAPSGTTHWIINGSIRGIPQGPWYRATNIAIVPVATPFVDIDWVNGELGALAAINFDPPPACTHVAAAGGVVMVLGTGTGGYGVRPSIVAQPEAYPPEFAFDLPVREAITGVQPGIDGVVLVSTANGLMGILLSGSEFTPLLARVIFGNVGFSHSNAFCSVYNEIYGMSSTSGAIRTAGSNEPDSSFAQAVQKFMERNGFTSANTVVAFDQAHDAVIFASGSIALPYMRATGRWSAPITLPGAVSAGIALNGFANLQVGSTVFALDRGGAGGAWFLRSPYPNIVGLGVGQAREFHGAANSAVTWDLLAPDATWESGTSIGGLFPYTMAAPFGAFGARVKKMNRRFRGGLALKVSGTVGNQTPEAAVLKGYRQPVAA